MRYGVLHKWRGCLGDRYVKTAVDIRPRALVAVPVLGYILTEFERKRITDYNSSVMADEKYATFVKTDVCIIGGGAFSKRT